MKKKTVVAKEDKKIYSKPQCTVSMDLSEFINGDLLITCCECGREFIGSEVSFLCSDCLIKIYYSEIK